MKRRKRPKSGVLAELRARRNLGQLSEEEYKKLRAAYISLVHADMRRGIE